MRNSGLYLYSDQIVGIAQTIVAAVISDSEPIRPDNCHQHIAFYDRLSNHLACISFRRDHQIEVHHDALDRAFGWSQPEAVLPLGDYRHVYMICTGEAYPKNHSTTRFTELPTNDYPGLSSTTHGPLLSHELRRLSLPH